MTASFRRWFVLGILLLACQQENGGAVGTESDGLIKSSRASSIETTKSNSLNPREFGAVGDGVSHSAQSTIGVSTLAELADFKRSGKQLYGFIKRYPYGVLFNLNPERPALAGSTTLDFKTTGVVAVQIPTLRALAPGSREMAIGDLFVTSDRTPIAKGTSFSCSDESGTRDTVASDPVGRPGQYELTLTTPIVAEIPQGTLCTFFVCPRVGSYSLPLVHKLGVNRGDLVTGAGIQPGTQVDWVNHAKMEIVLSLPLLNDALAGEVLSFTPSWLSKVSLGMEVSGAPDSVPIGETVASVDIRAAKVGLAIPLSGSVLADTAMIGVPKIAQTYATPITFYRPYSNREAAALQMDRLGIQAAINAAGTLGGAAIELPAGGPWQIDGPLIMPIFSPAGINQATVAFGGVAYAENGSVLLALTDFGPGTALISCGDPTAKSSNQRGLYSAPNGYLCTGSLHDMRLRPRGAAASVGLRPKWSGTPVAMDGVKEGPRLKWERISISGFDNGALAAFDHTRLSDTRLVENFIGLRLDDEQQDLHGDEVFDRIYITNNMWAALSISPKAYLNGEIRKPYFSNSPYGIYCEPGPNAKQCIQGTTIFDANNENIGCGSIKDGGIRDGFIASGGTRSIEHLLEVNTFELGRAGFGDSSVPRPAGGCEWAAYFDVGYVVDWTIENVWTNDFAPVKGAAAHILRASRIGGAQPMGGGGFRLVGGGVWNAIQNANRYRQNIVNGPAGFAGEFWHTASWQYVTFEGATFKARPIPFLDEGAPALPLGTLLEYKSQNADEFFGTRRATSSGAIAGVSCQDLSTNPYALQIAPVVCYGGSRVPVLTTSRAKAGQGLMLSNSILGRATPTASAGFVAAISMSDGVSETLTYAKPVWPGQD